MMDKNITKMQMLTSVVQRSITHNIFEVLFIITFVLMELILGGIWLPLLWVATGLAGLWTVLSSTRIAQDEAYTMVRVRQLFISDFISAALFMSVLALLSVSYGVGFSIIFLLATVQNIRYTGMTIDWLLEERDVKRKCRRDNLP